MFQFRSVAVMAFAGLSSAAVAQSDPWADAVVSYTAGDGVNPNFTDPNTALGSPERFTGEGVFPSSVTPFNSAFGTDELVSIGAGGQLTVRFDEAVRDDAANPFGIDLLIFGNAFFTTNDFSNPDPIISGLFSEGGMVEISADGSTFVTVTGVEADGGFPTLGFNDEGAVFGGPPGSDPTDFTKPVDPSLDPIGLSYSELIAAYDGSGGGVGIDIGAFGLSEVSVIRISVDSLSSLTAEIDAFADVAVPSPAGGFVIATSALLATRRRR